MAFSLKRSLSSAIAYTVRVLLRLRYRVEVVGLNEALKGHNKSGLLILPNHPGYTDPALVFSQIWPILHPRPLSWEGNWKSPAMVPFLGLVEAISIPDLSRPSLDAREKMKSAINKISKALHAGDNQILWPAGRIQRDGSDRLGGNSGVETILREAPNTDLLLIRTEGLWGSRFGFGFNGRAPGFSRQGLIILGWLISSFIFFMPKRNLKMHFRLLTPDQHSFLDRTDLNRLLEDFYNFQPASQPIRVPYHPFLSTLPKMEESENQPEEFDIKQFRPEIIKEVNHFIGEKIKRELKIEEINHQQKISDLGIDSLDLAELTLNVEHRYGFHTENVPQTIGALWALAHGTGPKPLPKSAPAGWIAKPGKNRVASMVGQSIPEALVRSCLKHGNRPALADDNSGMLTFQKFLIGAFALSFEIGKISESRVGVMLPASVGNDVVLFACFLSGKVPVLLNWTTGPIITAQCAKNSGVKSFLTSKKFMDRVGIEIPGVTPLFLEEIRAGIKKTTLISLLLRAKFNPSWFLRKIPHVAADQPAVVLFTSGSEKAPKAVPLTHNNLLSNQKAGIAHLKFLESDVFLGFLPAFHSFGLSVTSLFPIALGIRVVHHPDPTDGAALAHKIRNYQVNVILGTPTFLGMILDRSTPGDLASVRVAVFGAEKLSANLADRFQLAAPQMEILEGYGITECGPVVSANPPGATKAGSLGLPLPGTRVQIVDPDLGEPVKTGQRGMLLVSSASVFPGYEGSEDYPFEQREGHIWYRTGDLCRQDEAGYLFFEGRLKRFLKAGGEMVSLPALEDSFSKRFPPTENGPAVAVEGTDDHGRRWIVLFCNKEIKLEEANSVLMADGYRGVYRLDQVVVLPQIPVLGSGKTDYKQLRAQAIKLAPG